MKKQMRERWDNQLDELKKQICWKMRRLTTKYKTYSQLHENIGNTCITLPACCANVLPSSKLEGFTNKFSNELWVELFIVKNN